MASCTGNGSNGHHQFHLDVTETGTNVSNNTSTVHIHFYMTALQNGWDFYYRWAINWSVSVNGNNWSGQASDYGGSGTLNLFETDISVPHNSDGTKAIGFSFSQRDTTGQYYTPGNASGSGSMNLTTIPRTSNVSISPSSIECNGSNSFTINTNRASSSFTHTITYVFGNTSGTIATGVGSSTSWAPPVSLLNQIPYASSGFGSITCTTYSGGTAIGSSSVNFTITAGSAVVPTISGASISEQNGNVTSIAGSNATVGVISSKRITFNVTTKQGAGVYSVFVKNGSQQVGTSNSGSTYTANMSNLSSGSFQIQVTDTRGLSATQTINQTFYSYSRPTITDISITRDEPTQPNGKLQASGRFSTIFNNQVTINVSRSAIADKSYTRGGTSGSWSLTESYTDLYYTNAYSATVTVRDKFNESASVTVRLGMSMPTILFGKNGIIAGLDDMVDGAWINAKDNFDRIPLKATQALGEDSFHPYIAGKNKNGDIWIFAGGPEADGRFGFYGIHGDRTQNGVDWQFTWDVKDGTLRMDGQSWLSRVYPVGAIYISTVGTNPATLFGFGTWQEIQGRFLLARSSSHPAGSTGGEENHVLSLEEMPRHGHPAGEGIQFVTSGSPEAWDIATSSTKHYKAVIETATRGASKAHNTMPPYLSVYVWKRTA